MRLTSHVSRTALRVSVATLGCKVNQYESRAIEELLEARGHVLVPFGEPADAVVVNTCTVTHRSDSDARALLRRARRANPGARIVATGCYAQMDPEALVAVGADAVLGIGEKAGVPDALEAPAQRQGTPGDRRGAETLSVKAFPGRARAFLKVQDGCDCSCAYCIVPHARGASRSVPLPDVEKGLGRLRESGHREVVLTGVHLGLWGRDLGPAKPFEELLDAAEASGIPRIRLSSLEPGEVTSEVVGRLRASAALCPHLHVPLQSGSDRVLEAMGRPYTAAGFRERAEEALREVPGLCLGFDVIAGFPGEGEREFEETRALLGDLPFAYLHVFPFSVRKGTRAASLPGRVPEAEVRRRAALLRALSRERRHAFERAQVGREAQALAEGPPEDGILRVRTRNYVEVRIPWRGPAPAEEVTVLLERMSGGVVLGRPAGPASEGGG